MNLRALAWAALWLAACLTPLDLRAQPQPPDFDYGSQHAWLVDGPTCIESVGMWTLPRFLAGALDGMTREKAPQSSDEKETELGDRLLIQLQTGSSLSLDDSGRTHGYLAGVAENIFSKSCRKGMRYRIHLIDSSNIVAFSIPGGHVFLSQGILDKVIHNEAQLAFVIAHEVAHIDARHTMRLYDTLATVLGPLGADMHVLLGGLLRLPFSHSWEQEADSTGLRWVQALGYSPFQAALLFDRMAKSESPAPTIPDDPLAFLAIIVRELALDVLDGVSTHPKSSDRACAIKWRLYREYQGREDVGFFIGQTRYKSYLP